MKRRQNVTKKTVPADLHDEPVTCDICDDADALVDPFLATIARVRNQLKNMQKLVSNLKINALKLHLRCNKCGVYFGGTHSGGTLPVPDAQEGRCPECARKYLPANL